MTRTMHTAALAVGFCLLSFTMAARGEEPSLPPALHPITEKENPSE